MNMNKTQTFSELIGYFSLPDMGEYGLIFILDDYFAPNSSDYINHTDQLLASIDELDDELEENLKNKTYNTDYFGVGLAVPLYFENFKQMPEIIDIPVFIEYENNQIIGISIELEQWEKPLYILDREVYYLERSLEKSKKQYNYSSTEVEFKEEKILGYTSAIKGSILICESELIDLCLAYSIEDHPQIIVPLNDSNNSAGFRAGVLAPIPPNLTEEIHNIEYPVYGKYNGKSLSKIFINYKENWVVS